MGPRNLIQDNMAKLVREGLHDREKTFEEPVNFKEEIEYYTDMEDAIEEDDGYKKDYAAALEEFGVNKHSVGVISSYGASSNWEDIKDALDKKQVEYYEFDLYDGESSILVDINDFDLEEPEEERDYEADERDFKRRWGGAEGYI